MHSVMVSRSDDRPVHDRDVNGRRRADAARATIRPACRRPARTDSRHLGEERVGLHTLKGAVAPLTIQATLWDIGAGDITDVNGRRPGL